MPAVFILWSSGMHKATCSWVEVMIWSPRTRPRPFRMILMPSVAVLTSATSSALQPGPSSAAPFALMRLQSSSLWPGAGAASSRSIIAFTMFVTAKGDAPRPPVFR